MTSSLSPNTIALCGVFPATDRRAAAARFGGQIHLTTYWEPLKDYDTFAAPSRNTCWSDLNVSLSFRFFGLFRICGRLHNPNQYVYHCCSVQAVLIPRTQRLAGFLGLKHVGWWVDCEQRGSARHRARFHAWSEDALFFSPLFALILNVSAQNPISATLKNHINTPQQEAVNC